MLDNALSDPSYITRRFQQAQAARLNLMRFFIAGDEGGPVLATVPGAAGRACGDQPLAPAPASSWLQEPPHILLTRACPLLPTS